MSTTDDAAKEMKDYLDKQKRLREEAKKGSK